MQRFPAELVALAAIASCSPAPAARAVRPVAEDAGARAAAPDASAGSAADAKNVTELDIEPLVDPTPAVRVRLRLAGADETYTVPAAPRDDRLAVEQHAFRATGDAILRLPSARDGDLLHVRLRFLLAASGMERAVSSFAAGVEQRFDATVAQLRDAAFLAGPVYEASFDAYEGKDSLAWVGCSAFDPRWIAAEIATTRSAANEYFGERNAGSSRVLLSAESRAGSLSGPIAVLPRTRGMLVLADMNAPWSIRARMAVASALVGRWMAGRFDPALEPGLIRFVARDLLWRVGVMTPAELGDEVNALLSIAATSSSERASGIARAALWATKLDALARRRDPEHGFREVLLGALSRAKTPGVVDATTLAAAAKEEIPRSEAEGLPPQGGAVVLPVDALGKCFTRATMRFEELDLGFDEAESRAERALVKIGPKGPAARAGLAEGEALLDLRYDAANPSEPARVTVQRGAREVTVSYQPIGRVATGIGFKRVSGVPDSACRR